MSSAGRTQRWLRASVMLSLALLAACATPVTRPAHIAEPEPCRDSSYVELKRQHPDSLSERGWRELQLRERDCETARAKALQGMSQAMDAGPGGGHGMGLGAMAIMVMMGTMGMMFGMW